MVLSDMVIMGYEKLIKPPDMNIMPPENLIMTPVMVIMIPFMSHVQAWGAHGRCEKVINMVSFG